MTILCQIINTGNLIIPGPPVTFNIHVYGKPQISPGHESYSIPSLEAKFDITIPDITLDSSEKDDDLSAWVKHTAQDLLDDVKHTLNWHCAVCFELAKEEVVFIDRSNYPDVNVMVYLVCNATSEECQAVAQLMSSVYEGNTIKFTRPHTERHILVASCAGCKDVATAVLDLKRCTGCMLIRYCGTNCQLQDWARHKKSCKALTEKRWNPFPAPSLGE
ncbi:hypothetical protein QCA50_009784 [Cerrena zonata]|uniref:MYND-type domain-containing protein n=1 Tax=Cerrena zonata TaxID=2478898 RepID=A0AAW0GAS1_9APHY